MVVELLWKDLETFYMKCSKMYRKTDALVLKEVWKIPVCKVCWRDHAEKIAKVGESLKRIDRVRYLGYGVSTGNCTQIKSQEGLLWNDKRINKACVQIVLVYRNEILPWKWRVGNDFTIQTWWCVMWIWYMNVMNVLCECVTLNINKLKQVLRGHLSL